MTTTTTQKQKLTQPQVNALVRLANLYAMKYSASVWVGFSCGQGTFRSSYRRPTFEALERRGLVEKVSRGFSTAMHEFVLTETGWRYALTFHQNMMRDTAEQIDRVFSKPFNTDLVTLEQTQENEREAELAGHLPC